MGAWSERSGEFVGGVDYYELLGVERTASAADIRSAYRLLAKSLHPDRGGTAGTFRLIREAYETLCDPFRRADYDGSVAAPPPAPSTGRWRHGQRVGTLRDFGDDPDYTPPPPHVDPADISWWDEIDPQQRVRYVPVTGPAVVPLLAGCSAWVVFVLVGALVDLPQALRVLWLLLLLATGVIVLILLRRAFAAYRTDRLFKAEFRARVSFGSPDQDDPGKRGTVNLLQRYLVRLPGARVFHGLSWPDSVFADIDHAVLCGHRLVLVESKRWLPGHYTVDKDGMVWRNGHRFRGGGTRLPEGVAAFRKLLPGIDVRGVMLLYPCRAGVLTTELTDGPTLALTPEQFVREIGGWLAADPATADRDVFRAVLDRVVAG